jgi:hypothetical protein
MKGEGIMKRCMVGLFAFLLLSGWCFAGQPESDKHLKDLPSLRGYLKKQVLDNLSNEIFPELQPVAPNLRRIVNGRATDADISSVRKFILKLISAQRDGDDSMHAASLVAVLYVFEGDLKAARMYTQKTGEFVVGLMGFIARPDGSVRQAILGQLDAGEVVDYIVDGLALKSARRVRTFYEGGSLRFSSGELFYMQLLAHLPESTKRDRMLVNYPFERTGVVWQVHTDRDRVEKLMPQLPEQKRPLPENIFGWYYSEVVKEAGLEKEFRQQLELRNLHAVIRRLPEADAEQR